MADRELLELAAKAAGIVLAEWSEIEQGFRRADGGYFRPHIDDGDALRLAVTLNMQIEVWGLKETPMVYATVNGALTVENIFNDPYAATRRAIVRAAAEIGKELK